MKILITGHSKGIGKAIYDLLKLQGHDVIGLSRSNNFDINDICLTDHLHGVDVFINNAYVSRHQSRLLKEAIQYWNNDSSKLIININSKLSLVPIDTKTLDQWTKDYINEKKYQSEIVNKLFVAGGVKICNLIIGLAKTDMSKDVFDSPIALDPKYIAQTVNSVIKLSPNINIQSIVVDAPGLNWQNIKRLM